jgi:hypothetical protein
MAVKMPQTHSVNVKRNSVVPRKRQMLKTNAMLEWRLMSLVFHSLRNKFWPMPGASGSVFLPKHGLKQIASKLRHVPKLTALVLELRLEMKY